MRLFLIPESSFHNIVLQFLFYKSETIFQKLVSETLLFYILESSFWNSILDFVFRKILSRTKKKQLKNNSGN